MTAPEITEDALLDGRVRLRQPARGHRAGTDAVLLAAFADARAGDHVADLGSASGAAGLMLAARVALGQLTLIERDPALVALAAENIGLNGLAGRAVACEADAFAERAAWAASGAPFEAADLCLTNPPFFPEGSRASPDPGRRAAHVLEGGTLADWLAAAARLLRPRGRLCLIHRADQIETCLAALRPAFGSLALRPVHPRADAPASRILVSALKGGRAPTTLLPPHVLHDGKAFTPATEGLHRSAATP